MSSADPRLLPEPIPDLTATDPYPAVPDPDAVPVQRLTEAQRERPALLLGAEGPGLSGKALAASDVPVRIPMRRGVDSLNVAAAAAVAFWELSRTDP